MKSIGCWLLAFCVLGLPGQAWAEATLQRVQWMLARNGRNKGVLAYQAAREWSLAPAIKPAGKARAVVTVSNRGTKAAEGVLLRYAVSAHVVPVQNASSSGMWTIPFWIEERRVPLVRAGQTREIPIDRLLLAPFLRKMYLAGFWPDALKIQVMVEPRSGESLEGRLLEETLPVTWKR